MNKIKQAAKRIPIVKEIHRRYTAKNFVGSEAYWESRYATGGNSGAGSYGRLAQFKADFLNKFVKDNGVKRVIEFGCGDGNQLSLAEYPEYLGLDVSRSILQTSSARFVRDPAKSFYIYDTKAFVDNAGIFVCDLSLSLDVIYHLIEDEIFNKYMADLFHSSSRFVIIYSSDQDLPATSHVRQRKFTNWVSTYAVGWKLREKVANPYPFDPNNPDETSIADFFIFEKV